MRLWLLRFVCAGSGAIVDLRFTSEAAAESAFKTATEAAGPWTYTDSFGQRFHIQPGHNVLLLTPDASVAGDRAQHEANQAAASLAQQPASGTTILPGQTRQ